MAPVRQLPGEAAPRGDAPGQPAHTGPGAGPPAAPLLNRVARNVVSNIGGLAVSIGVTFFLFPFTLAHIGAAAYGILVLANSIVGYSGMLAFGLRPTLIKRSAEHLAQNDRHMLGTVVNQVFTLYCSVSGIVFLLSLAGTWALPWVLNIDSARVGLFRTVFVLVGLQAVIVLPGSVWAALVEGLQDYHVANAVRIGSELTRAAATVALLLMGYGLVELVMTYLALSTAQLLVHRWWVRRRLPDLRVRFTRTSWDELKPLLRFSGGMFVLSASGSGEQTADKVVIGAGASPAAVAVFEVASRLDSYGKLLVVQAVNVIMPASSALMASGNRTALRNLMIKGSRAIILLHGIALVLSVAFGREFIRLWVGRSFDEAYAILVLLMVAAFIHIHVSVPSTMCRGMGILGVMTRVAVVRALVNIGLSILLIGPLGITGVALATAVAFAGQTVVLIRYFAGIFQLGVARLFTSVYLRAWIPLAAAGSVAVLAKQVHPVTGWLILGADAAVVALVAATLFWFSGVTPEDRRRLVALVRSRTLRYA